jgi:two-component system, NarL family, response regulator DesR
MTRVGIVEDHAAIADALAALIGSDPDIDVSWVSRTAAEAGVHLRAERPDVVLCDVMLEGRDAGFELLADHGSRTRFIFYTAFDFPDHHRRALEGGAAGFLPKVTPAEQIVAAIRTVHAGGRVFPGHILRSARTAPRAPTPRELDLLRLVAEGVPNDDIAAQLGVRRKTVEGTLRRLFDRYGCENRTQLARTAMRQGWLTGR